MNAYRITAKTPAGTVVTVEPNENDSTRETFPIAVHIVSHKGRAVANMLSSYDTAYAVMMALNDYISSAPRECIVTREELGE